MCRDLCHTNCVGQEGEVPTKSTNGATIDSSYPDYCASLLLDDTGTDDEEGAAHSHFTDPLKLVTTLALIAFNLLL